MIKRLPIDPFLLKLFATVALASLLPAQGWGVPLFQHITQIAIALLFFLHGARLSREAIWGGLSHWRLHLLILSVTFLLFPILGSGVAAVLRPCDHVDARIFRQGDVLRTQRISVQQRRALLAHRLRRTGRVGIEMSQQLAVLANDQPVSVHRVGTFNE